MTTVSQQTIKNKCAGCKKIVLIHNKIMSCELCNKIVHSECARYIFEYNHLRNLWQCLECTKTEKKRYNPFSAINFDKYDPVQITESEDIAEISNVLESCKSYERA